MTRGRTSTIFEQLVDAASSVMMGTHPAGRSVKYYLERGREIPEWWLPGRMLQNIMRKMSEQDLEALSELKGEHTFHRHDCIELAIKDAFMYDDPINHWKQTIKTTLEEHGKNLAEIENRKRKLNVQSSR